MRARPPASVIRIDDQGREIAPRRNARNRKPSECEACGIDLDVGEGRVWWCSPTNTWGGCDDPSHQMGGGAHVTCLDAGACRKQQEIVLRQDRRRQLDGDKVAVVSATTEPAFPPHELESSDGDDNTEGERSNAVAAPSHSEGETAPSSLASTIPGISTPRRAQDATQAPLSRSQGGKCQACGARLIWFTQGTGLDCYQCEVCQVIFDIRRCCGHAEEYGLFGKFDVPMICPSCGVDRTPVKVTSQELAKDGTLVNHYGIGLMEGGCK